MATTFPTLVNNLSTRLGAAYVSGASLTLATGYGATIAAKLAAESQPSLDATNWMRVTVDNGTAQAVFKATALTGDVLTVSLIEGAVPGGGFTTGTTVQGRWTSGTAREIFDAINTLEDAGGGSLADLSDVVITTATTGDLLRYNGSAWANLTSTLTFNGSGYPRIGTEASNASGHSWAISGAGLLTESATAWSNTSTYHPTKVRQRSRGTSGSKLAVQSGDYLGSISDNAWDGSAWATVVGERSEVLAAYSSAPGGKKVFSTRTTDSTFVDRVAISSAGLQVMDAAGTAVAATISPAGAVTAASLSLTTPAPVASGGTGATSLTSGAVLVGAGTSAVSASNLSYSGTTLSLAASSGATTLLRATSHATPGTLGLNLSTTAIDPSGYVGIGTATPAGSLDIAHGPNSGYILRAIRAGTSRGMTVDPSGFLAFTSDVATNAVCEIHQWAISRTSSSGNHAIGVSYAVTINPTSGSDRNTGVRFTGNVNQTGGTHPVRFLLVDPTLTSVTGDYAPAEFISGSPSYPSLVVTTSASPTVPSVSLRLPSSTAVIRQAGGLLQDWVVSTDATRAGRVKLIATDYNGNREGLRVASNGSAALLGFYGATAAVQPSAVADATDAASAITQLNALLSRLRTLGLIAT